MVWAQGQVKLAKVAKKSSTYDVTHKKSASPTQKNVFHCKLQDLPNLLSLWTALYNSFRRQSYARAKPHVIRFLGVKSSNITERERVNNCIVNFWSFGHNFEIRYAKKSIKPLKDMYYSLVSNKNTSQKMALGVGIQCLMMSCKCKQVCINILLSCPHQQKQFF